MERRILIFTDEQGDEIGRTEHDNSIINSLPRTGDSILEKTKLDFQEEEHVLQAFVELVEFDYNMGDVTIYAKVVRSA